MSKYLRGLTGIRDPFCICLRDLRWIREEKYPLLIFLFLSLGIVTLRAQAVSFGATALQGESLLNPTSLDIGPNGKLYVSQVDGTIYEFTVERDNGSPGNGKYTVTNTLAINTIKNEVVNHNDDGAVNTTKKRQITGILASGTAANPVLYVSSSDWRIGGKSTPGNDLNLDTNSGVLTRLSWNGSQWERVDLVRGLPRCEENHSTNGMDLFIRNGQKYLLLQQGGNTNQGAPSNNFAGATEYYLAGALLIVNLTQLETMEVNNGGPYIDQRDGVTPYVYDLPTLDDPERQNISNSHSQFPYTPGHPMYNAVVDIGDPFGGNNGLNQSFPEAGGPVQIFSPGYRNAYDVVVTESGRVYTSDNGPNAGWGGPPVIRTGSGSLKGDHYSTSYLPGSGDYVTNDFNVSNGKTHGDQLHFIGSINDANNTYYAGHPVPIRAFPSKANVVKHIYDFTATTWVTAGTYSWSSRIAGVRGYFKSSFTMADFPDDPRQGAYTTDNLNDPTLNMLDITSSSTNGICEYTASNFNNALKGNLLTASFGGTVNRYVLNAAGDGYTLKNNSFLSGFGSQPLDVIAMGDADPFPGTIWAATYGAGNITIFEPADYTDCLQPGSPGYDPLADYDGDGFTNADEVANGTNICSAGSKPNDADGDLISDLSDPDDDNDGIPDLSDVFALDDQNGMGTNLPVVYPFWNNDPGTGLFGLGFTGLMLNPAHTTDYLTQFDPDNLSFGGAGGKATVDAVTGGSAQGGINTQQNAFQFGVNADSNDLPFTIHGRIETPFNGEPAYAGQSYGIFMGTGDQNNYLKVAVMEGNTSGDAILGLEIVLEQNGQVTQTDFDIPGLAEAINVDLYFSVHPEAGTAQVAYSLDNGESVVLLGNPVQLPTSFLNPSDNLGLAVGIISTSGTSGQSYVATWDFLNVTLNQSNTLIALPETVNFGSLSKDGSGGELILELSNAGGALDNAIEVTGITFSGGTPSFFDYDVTVPLSISPGTRRTVPVTVTPDGSTTGNRETTLVLTHSGSNSPLQIPLAVVFTEPLSETPLLRINAGGASYTALDGGPNWLANNTNGAVTTSAYSVNTGTIYPTSFDFANRHSSIPDGMDENTFTAIFAQERYMPDAATSMVFDIPVPNGNYKVRLYLGNSFIGTSTVGARVFDISLEGIPVADNVDPVAQFGHQVGGMLSFNTTVGDGVLNVGFTREVENPNLYAIEVLSQNTTGGDFPALSIASVSDRTDTEGSSPEISVAASGGDPEENFNYSLSGQPAGIQIEPTNGLISGTIATGASQGGPSGNGVYQVTILVSKSGSATVTETFQWTVIQNTAGISQWIDKNENETYTARSECSFVQAGDRFYLFGGRNLPKNLDIYNYSTNTWQTLSNSAPEDFNHFQAVTYDGLIWVIGAFITNNFPTETSASFIWAFDPVSGKWLKGPEIPESRRRGSTGLVVYNNKFYIVGGNTKGHDGGYVSWFDEYDPHTGVWKTLANAPRARDHFHAAVIGTKMYLAGGRLTGGTGGTFAPLVPEVDVYDFASGTWSTLPPGLNLPTPRGAAVAVNYKGKLLVAGGEIASQTTALSVTEIFDPVLNAWSAGDPLNFGRHGTQAIVSGEGVFVTGGSPNRGGGSQKNMEVYHSDQPQGTTLQASSLTVPTSLVFAPGESLQIPLQVSGGNVGIFVNSISLTGTNASLWSVNSAPSSGIVLRPNTTRNISVTYNGTTQGAVASLQITYQNDLVKTISLGTTEPVSSGPTVVSFTLIDAVTNNDILTISNGLVLDAALYNGRSMNIRANTSPAVTGSVLLSLNGPASGNRTESSAPYALFGDKNGDYYGQNFVSGSYTMQATPFSAAGGNGTAGTPLTVSFTIGAPSGGSGGNTVSSFTLIDAVTNSDLLTLTSGQVLDASVFNGRSLNIRANTSPSVVGSVVINLSGALNATRTETAAPYALFGDRNGDYYGQTFVSGNYTIQATPYSASGGSGTAGNPLSLGFSIGSQLQSKVWGVSPETSVEEEFSQNILSVSEALLVYPNPVSTELFLKPGRAEAVFIGSLALYDMQGRWLRSYMNIEVPSEGYGIPVHDLSPGVYLLQIYENNEVIKSLRFVKNPS